MGNHLLKIGNGSVLAIVVFFIAAFSTQLFAYETASSFRYPLDSGGWYLSQDFGVWNDSFGGYHLGEDCAVNDGTELPVYAPANGIVKHNSSRTSYGRVVIIEHRLPDGNYVCSVHGHMRSADIISVGTEVSKGDLIGYLSDDYNENGGYSFTHLHFGIRTGAYSSTWVYSGYGNSTSGWYDPGDYVDSQNAGITVVLTKTATNHTIQAGSQATVYGTALPNDIALESGAKAELINFPGSNNIEFKSDSNLFTVFRSGTAVTFEGTDGTVLKIPATRSVQTLAFADRAPLTLSIYNKQVMLDDQVVTTTPASIDGGSEESEDCGAYVAPGVWKKFDCYNLAAIGKIFGTDPLTPSWELIGGYWQWGRKGPDQTKHDWYKIATEHFAPGPSGGGSAVEDANAGSIIFWDTIYAPDGAWKDDEKTANDPCPEGYRVPTRAQWDAFVDNNTQSKVGSWSSSATNYTSALYLGSDLMLPAAGYRFSSSGELYRRGYYGYYWSSSEYTSKTYARSLKFYSINTSTYNSHRVEGLSVRCVAE